MSKLQKSHMKQRKRWLIAALLGAGVLATAGYAILPMTTGDAIAAGEGKKAQAQMPRVAEGDNLFVDHGKQAGIKTCRDLFPALGAQTVDGSTFGMATFWNQKAGDKHAIGSLAGLSFNTPSLQSLGAGIAYSAPVNGGCEGVSVRIVPIPTKCSDFVSSLSSDVVAREDLTGVPLMMLKSGAKVMAITVSADLCVAVTTIFGNGALE